MISSDYAPNEGFADALTSLSMLFTPWKWRKGRAQLKVRQKLKKLLPSHEPFLFLTGRAGLYKLFQSLDFMRSCEVAVVGFTCEAVVLPLLALDLKPVYVDIETDTYSMSLEDLKRKITPKTKALVLQHTFSMTPKQREPILALAKSSGLIVIEDLAHGFHKDVFTKPRDSIFLMSFGRSKSLSSVFGGAVLSKNSLLNKKLKEAEKTCSYPSSGFVISALWYKPTAWFIKKTYGLYVGKLLHALLTSLSVIPREISAKEKRGDLDSTFIKGYPNALATLLLTQFKRFDRIRKNRVSVSNYYKMTFSTKLDEETTTPMIRFPFLVEDRKKLLLAAKKKKIYLGSWYDQIVAPKEIPLNKLLYKKGSCPVAEVVCEKIVNLPTNISLKEAKKVADLVIASAT